MRVAAKPEGTRAVPPGVEYHRVLAGDTRRIGRGILAIVLLLAGIFGTIQLFYIAGVWIDGLIRPEEVSTSQQLSPITLASSLVATALVVPWSMLIQRWLYGVAGPSLHSVVSRFRFDLFGVHGRWTSLILGIAVSSAVFAVIHTAGDPWWNVLYVVLSLSIALITWRTGGIEIALIVHALYNVLSFVFWFILGADLAERFDRTAGAVTPALFIPSSLAIIGVAVVVWMRTRRTGPAKTPPA